MWSMKKNFETQQFGRASGSKSHFTYEWVILFSKISHFLKKKIFNFFSKFPIFQIIFEFSNFPKFFIQNFLHFTFFSKFFFQKSFFKLWWRENLEDFSRDFMDLRSRRSGAKSEAVSHLGMLCQCLMCDFCPRAQAPPNSHLHSEQKVTAHGECVHSGLSISAPFVPVWTFFPLLFFHGLFFFPFFKTRLNRRRSGGEALGKESIERWR